MVSAMEFEQALASYWSVREQQGLVGGGEGSGANVRGGKHLDKLAALVATIFLDAGFPPSSLFTGRHATLPGYYRVTKNWDLVVRDRGELVAAFELKSLAGPSFGNNFNNRTEEALGNAIELRRAHREGSIVGPEPFLGYLLLIEDAFGSTVPIQIYSELWPADHVFQGASYIERGQIFGERALGDKIYNAVCYVTSSRNPGELPKQPSALLTWDAFRGAVEARIATHRAS